MNILTPYSWLKDYIKTDLDASSYAKKVALIGNEVERQVHPGEGLDGVVVGELLEIRKHPNADKLHLARVDVGRNDPIDLIFGSMVDMEVGLKVPVAVAPTTLPGGVEIKKTKMRGEVSEGMLCLDQELGLLKSGVSIRFFNEDVKNGTPIADVLELNDEVIFDIEITTNRPDTMSMVGQAREAFAADLGTFDDPMRKPPNLPESDETKDVFSLEVRDQDLCPRYMGVALEVKVGPSPWWMQKRLLMAGAKPINNVVDVTNYVRLEYGQPLHAFDADKIADKKIIVRRAEEGESFIALDETEHALTSDMLVIADGQKPVAVGGVMGGMNSGVSDKTKTIVLESAVFDPLSIRNTWRALNLQSDSQALYEKGLSTELPAYGLARAIELLKDVASARVISNVQDVRSSDYAPLQFELDPKGVAGLIGVDIDRAFQTRTLDRLGFTLSGSGDVQQATVPFWRDNDIEADVDLTEEIARVYGYANLPSTLPTGEIPRRERDVLLDMEERIKDLLSGYGWTELYSNSFIHPEDAERCGFDAAAGLSVANPLSADESLMRTSLLPSFLRTLVRNEGRDGCERLFELQHVYLPRKGDLPEERSMLLVGLVHHVGGEELFRHTKGALDVIANTFRIQYALDRDDVGPQYHPGRSARVVIDGKAIGTIGELHPLVLQAFGIDDAVATLELDLPALLPLVSQTPTYVEPASVPPALRDVALLVDESVDYDVIEHAIRAASTLVSSIELFDLYRGSQIPSGKKSLALHLTLQSDETLTSEQIDEAMKAIENALKKQGAEIRE